MITDSICALIPSPWRRLFCAFFFVGATIAAWGTIDSLGANWTQDGPLSGAAATKKIAPWVIEHTAHDQQAEFFVVLAEQADLRAAANLLTKAEKGRFVFQTLFNKAQTTQWPILQWMRERGLEHRSFYIVNAILVKGTRQIVEALAARQDVARVEGNPQIHNELPQPGSVEKAPSGAWTPATVEPGIAYTHAPQVWALGFTGQNIVVANADTGVRWTHNALKPHYRGWDGHHVDHDYNWHDAIHAGNSNPCGNDSPVPCDDDGHGTHTTGTAVGDDGAGNQIGMAPGAKWIACRNEVDDDTGTPASYLECMEFFLAPYPVHGTPNEADPSKAPDITSNSWGCFPQFGCSPVTLQAAVEAQVAAGIMMVVAAGNDGPNCSTVIYPPCIYEAAYTVGALETGTDSIAYFSSRGPVMIDQSNRIKPNITAPGTETRSSYNTSDDAYYSSTGTSMASPHVAGAVALLWSARPELQNDISSTRSVLDRAAVHILDGVCDGGPPVTPNNTYGNGRLDILAAVNTRAIPTPRLHPTPAPRP
jgi:serine protease AprX